MTKPDAKTDDAAVASVPVEMVAMKLAFYNGAMVHPGQTFMFTGKVLPKWAKPASEKPIVPKAPPLNGDTKPKDAQAAVKKKVLGNE